MTTAIKTAATSQQVREPTRELDKAERRDELLDTELDAVHGGLVVNAIIAILISPLLPSPPTKATSN
jgi:hypothetical protein